MFSTGFGGSPALAPWAAAIAQIDSNNMRNFIMFPKVFDDGIADAVTVCEGESSSFSPREGRRWSEGPDEGHFHRPGLLHFE